MKNTTTTPTLPDLMNTLRQAFDHLGVTFFAIDHKGEYWHQNTPLAHFTQAAYRADTVSASAWADCQAVMASRKPKVVEETSHGKTFLSVKAPVLQKGEDVVGVVGLALDITGRKEAEQALQHAHRRQRAFLDNISHEFRLPAATIASLATQLVIDFPSHRTALSLQQMSDSFLSVVNNLLSHIAYLEEPAEAARPIVVRSFVDTLLGLYQVTVQKKSLELGGAIDADVPTAFIQSAYPLQMLLGHLLSNAIKFTPQGKVTLRVSQDTSTQTPTLRWQVEDTGIGISVEQQATIFEAFERLHPTAQSDYPGLGLGLTQAKKLAQTIGATLTVNSELGQGSCFTLMLPYQPVDVDLPSETTTSPETPLASETQQRYTREYTLLVVEDHPVAQQAIKILLTRQGHHVDIVNNGKAALAQVKQTPYDLVFMDIGLKNESGLDVTRAIRAWEATRPTSSPLPIVALTAHERTPAFVEECREAGMQEVLSKPLTLEKLAGVLGSLGSSQEKVKVMSAT